MLEGLAQRGFPSTLVTLESERDLSDRPRLHRLRARARSSGIKWTWGVYRERGTSGDALRNLAELSLLAAQAAIRDRPTHLHARGYHAGCVAWGLRRALGLPWIFDARGFWVDERIEEGRWFTTPTALWSAREIERLLYQNADAVVTLTKLHATDLRALGLRPGNRPTTVIPTCADFDDFRPFRPADLDSLPARLRNKLAGRSVYGIIGSLNRAYLSAQTAELANRCLKIDPSAELLVLTKQTEEWTQVLERSGVDLNRTTCIDVPHEEMPRWMRLITWCLMLLAPETKAKRAAMPTKLAELLASNVRIAFHGCNSEAAEWVRRSGAGLVLANTDRESLDAAALSMCSASSPTSTPHKAVADHFSLSSGLARYEAIIRNMIK